MRNLIFITAAVLLTIFLSSCSSEEQSTQTDTQISLNSDSETTPTASNDTEETTVSLIESIGETTTEHNITGNPEDGLVYFVQPSIILYPRYPLLDAWECRDSEVLRDFHYDGEWDYCKELIFAFSNYTDEPVTVDSIQIFCGDKPVSFTNGADTLDINFTVQPLHKTDYLLLSEDFDYSACESGIYRTVVNIGGEKSERKFFINNCGLSVEKHVMLNYWGKDDNGNTLFHEYDVFAPTFLNEEQQHIFAQANGVMLDWFWCDHHMPQDYVDKHTPDDFLQMLYGVFTKEYADELAKYYIDENGEFLQSDGARGSNICYFDHCFIPVSSDENTVEFKAVVTYCHSDNPYDISFDDDFHYVMKNTEDGWRVDRFDVWN